jgi:hypothetical protein
VDHKGSVSNHNKHVNPPFAFFENEVDHRTFPWSSACLRGGQRHHLVLQH